MISNRSTTDAGTAAQGARPAGSAILAEITADLAAGSDLRELLNRLLDPIVRLAGAQAGAVRVLSDEGGSLRLVSDVGLPGSVCGAERSVDRHCGYCGEAADAQRVVWASDLSRCSARNHGEYFGRDCRRMLVVPLQHRGRMLGVYNLFFDSDAEPSPDILALLTTVGGLLGLALNNAQLEAENMRAIVMQERQAMAAEVHDSVAQTLTFVKMRLPLLHDAVVAHDDARALKYLSDVREATGEAHASLREIVTHYRTRLDARGLMPALDALAARFPRRTGIDLTFANRVRGLKLPAGDESEVFHIVQEALANIERHSGARHAWLTVEPTLAGVELRVDDDGNGPTPRVAAGDGGSHYGIGIMCERAQRIGGELSVAPRPGGGTRVRLALPAAARTGAVG
jgi:two-component system nitrate/nitrite sensor histidine kinase NarX